MKHRYSSKKRDRKFQTEATEEVPAKCLLSMHDQTDQHKHIKETDSDGRASVAQTGMSGQGHNDNGNTALQFCEQHSKNCLYFL